MRSELCNKWFCLAADVRLQVRFRRRGAENPVFVRSAELPQVDELREAATPRVRRTAGSGGHRAC